MQLIKKQKGLTGISIMLILVLIAFVAIVTLKILPIYMDSFKVNDVLSTLKEERGLGDKTGSEIRSMLLKRLDVNMVTDVTRDDIVVEVNKDTIFVEIEYEVRKNMFGNLDVVVSFDKTIEAPTI